MTCLITLFPRSHPSLSPHIAYSEEVKYSILFHVVATTQQVRPWLFSLFQAIKALTSCVLHSLRPWSLSCHLQTFVGILKENGKNALLGSSGYWMPEQGRMEGPTLRLEKLHKQAGDGERMGRTEVSTIGFSTVELMMTLMRGFGRAEGAHT